MLEHAKRRTESARRLSGAHLHWLRMGKAYVALHVLVAICTCAIGLEHYVNWRNIPVAIYVPVKLVAMLGFMPFLFSAPIASFVMLVVMTPRHRKWLYFGLLEVAVIILHVVGVIAASV